jgi:hypothetical protein
MKFYSDHVRVNTKNLIGSHVVKQMAYSVDPLLTELSYRSERLLDMMNDGIDRMLTMERSLQRQIQELENPVPSYTEPLVLGNSVDVFRHYYADEIETVSVSSSEDDPFWLPPITEDHVRFNDEIRIITTNELPPPGRLQRVLSHSTIRDDYTPFYYDTHKDDDSDTETLLDFVWEDPYTSPFTPDDDEDHLTEAFR